MIDRSSLSYWTEKDKKIEAAHLLDLCEKTLTDGGRTITPFLTASMAEWFRHAAHKIGLDYVAWGGFEDAERVRFVLDGDRAEHTHDDAQISLVLAVPNQKEITLKHRDTLGSLMGLGLKRDVIGDIRQSKNGMLIAITYQILGYILQNWHEIGRNRIKTSVCSSAQSVLPVSGVEKRIVSVSSRVDCIAASGFSLSRTEVQELIKHGKLKKNDLVVLKADAEVKEGDILSLRGSGRIKVIEETGTTKKGKCSWKVFLYQNKI